MKLLHGVECLANFGIGLDNAVASADEVAQAIDLQDMEKTALLEVSQAKTKEELKIIAEKFKPVRKLIDAKLKEKYAKL